MLLKTAIRTLVSRFGYEITRSASRGITTSQSPIDAFAVQSRLIANSEPIIFDVGAYVGDVAKAYRARFPDASIYCFEPSPQSFQVLKRRAERDVLTFCHQTALSDRKGTRLLNENVSSATNSLLTTDSRGSSFWGEGVLETTARTEVPTTTLDAFCRADAIPHIDILKLDVQGAEFSVLVGATDMLASQRVSLIYCELITCPTYSGQHKIHEYFVLLESLGYEFLDFFNPVRRYNQLIQADVIFLSASFKDDLTLRRRMPSTVAAT